MAVHSLMVPVGTAMPAFSAPDLTGAQVSSESFAGAPLLVVFACNHCPYVKHVEQKLGDVIRSQPGLAVVAVSTNDASTHPDDDAAHLAAQAQRAGWDFPYLLDTTQQIGRDFGAACTPDFFLYDGEGRLAYRGAMDASTPGNGQPVTGELLADAIRLVLAGELVPQPHRPSMGCSIKWRS